MKPTTIIALALTLLAASGCTSTPEAPTLEVTRVSCTAAGVLSYDVTIRNDSEKALTIAEWDATRPENNFTFKTDARAQAAAKGFSATPTRPLTIRPAQAVSTTCSFKVIGGEGLHHADIAVKAAPQLRASFDFDLPRDTRQVSVAKQ